MKTTSGSAGFTLVEILLTITILAILALAGSAVSATLGTGIFKQNHRCIALHQASRRMEQVVRIPYAQIRPQNSNQAYINSNNRIVAGHPHETIFINGYDRPISTTVKLIEEGAIGIEYLEITTRVEYDSSGNAVVLKTIRK